MTSISTGRNDAWKATALSKIEPQYTALLVIDLQSGVRPIIIALADIVLNFVQYSCVVVPDEYRLCRRASVFPSANSSVNISAVATRTQILT